MQKTVKPKSGFTVFIVYIILFCVIECSAFSYDINLNLSWLFNIRLNLTTNISCKKNHLVVLNLFRLNNDSDFSTSLNCKATLNTIKA